MFLVCHGAGPGVSSKNILLTKSEVRQIAKKYGFKKWQTADLNSICNFIQIETEYFKYFGHFEMRHSLEELIEVLLRDKIFFII